jgi:hypothetical protein
MQPRGVLRTVGQLGAVIKVASESGDFGCKRLFDLVSVGFMKFAFLDQTPVRPKSGLVPGAEPVNFDI